MGCPIETNLAPDGEVNLLCVGGFVLYLRRGDLYYFVFRIARQTLELQFGAALCQRRYTLENIFIYGGS
jgi:hypothetical protein